ncbi:hypothetical protein [Cysteiniphilum halobium]|uniref:hypothetical protein n=1 Tax=Cysteiniphilum halobium TaxID=2219059 RepID=UPI000E65B536|nr:hypothetical protein [Cysteiniphilum halobium]
MKKMLSIIVIGIFLSGNMAFAAGTDFPANSVMGNKLMKKDFQSSSVQRQKATVYFQETDL